VPTGGSVAANLTKTPQGIAIPTRASGGFLHCLIRIERMVSPFPAGGIALYADLVS